MDPENDQSEETSASPVPTPPVPKETDWKAEARKWEARAKENREAAKANEDAAQRLAEIEEANKTEAEKQAEDLAAAQKRIAEYERREQEAQWAKEVAEDTGIPVEALRGSTKEALEAHAQQLKSLGVGQVPPAPPVPTIGLNPDLTGNITIAQQIVAAEKAGDTDLVGQLKAMQLGAMRVV